MKDSKTDVSCVSPSSESLLRVAGFVYIKRSQRKTEAGGYFFNLHQLFTDSDTGMVNSAGAFGSENAFSTECRRRAI